MSTVEARCPTCAASTRPGLLWLGGNDWVECPDCDPSHPGVIAFDESRFAPVERTVFIPGLRAHVERRVHPSVERLY